MSAMKSETQAWEYDPRCEAVHEWFGLTYASYLVLPRSLLEAMPGEFQERFVACLRELQEEWDGFKIRDSYTVHLRDEKGRFIEDPLREYRRPDRGYIESLRRREEGGEDDTDHADGQTGE